MTVWIPELLETKPKEFTYIGEGMYLQRKDIHEAGYNSIDGSQTFRGYECYCRVINRDEYEKALNEANMKD